MSNSKNNLETLEFLEERRTLLHNKKVLLTSDGRLEVYNHRLATKLNKHFKEYDDGKYRFRAGEEAVFQIEPSEISFILETFLVKKPRQPKAESKKLGGAA